MSRLAPALLCGLCTLGALGALAPACVELDDLGPEVPAQGELGSASAEVEVVEDDCDYITCGNNTGAMSNDHVDQIYFDGSPNARDQRFVSWVGAGGEAIAPVMLSRSVAGAVGNLLRVGTDLTGSVITLSQGGRLVKLRFVDARRPTLPNGLAIWVYRLDVWRVGTGWRPLCPLFEHSSDDIARYAIPGTREVVHADTRTITPHAYTEGKLTLGCPNTAPGKLLSLGAVTTTAIASEVPTLEEMRALLLALTLSPVGDLGYTEAGVRVMFKVIRTAVDNTGEGLSGGLEGKWDAQGAICFDRLRSISDAQRWALWGDTHVPSCSEPLDPQRTPLVWTHRFAGVYPAYPPAIPPVIVIGS